MALTYGEITAITEKYFKPRLVDNIFSSNVLFARMKDKQETLDGGEKVLLPVAYAVTTASGSYSGADTLDTTPNDQITAAEFDWTQYYANITITGLDELKNAGDAAKVSLVKSKVQMAEKSLASNLGTDVYNLGTTTGALIGLRLAVDSTGTYGGIARGTYTWWAAQEDGTNTVLSIPVMEALYGDCTVGNDKPTVMVTTQDIFDDFFSLLQPQQRFQDTKTADAGFTNLVFRGCPVIVDQHCPASHMFMLNEDYIKLMVHSKRNFKMEPFVKPVNQDVATAKIYWAGILASSNSRMHGKLNAIA
jgi:hypothetical protein